MDFRIEFLRESRTASRISLSHCSLDPCGDLIGEREMVVEVDFNLARASAMTFRNKCGFLSVESAGNSAEIIGRELDFVLSKWLSKINQVDFVLEQTQEMTHEF